MRTRKCDKCRADCIRSEMIEYTPVGCKNAQVLCRNCYEERIAYEKFSDGICKIFGLKKPGPIINKQRRTLLDKGYTDEVILDCLDYVYNVKKLKKLSETLVLVTPENINAMMNYKKFTDYKTEKIAKAMVTTQVVEHVVPIKENTKSLMDDWDLNPDDWLDID